MTERPASNPDLSRGLVATLALWLFPSLRPTPAQVAAELERLRQLQRSEPEAGF